MRTIVLACAASVATLNAATERAALDEGFRGWPPAEATYAFPSSVRIGDTKLGEIDTIHLHVGYIATLSQTADFDWLLGVDWRYIVASLPESTPLPNTLQSAAAVVGFDWRFRDPWRLRLELAPGIYSDFRDISGDDVNAPLAVEVSYQLNPNLLLGAQLSVDGRRDAPVVPGIGLRWLITDQWLLSFWFPRPQIEYRLNSAFTFFGGASFAGGTYQVSEDFGRRVGRSELDDTAVDYREIRVGGGLRLRLRGNFAAELAGGWFVDRRYHFHRRDLLVNGDGAPYVQVGAGLLF